MSTYLVHYIKGRESGCQELESFESQGVEQPCGWEVGEALQISIPYFRPHFQSPLPLVRAVRFPPVAPRVQGTYRRPRGRIAW